MKLALLSAAAILIIIVFAIAYKLTIPTTATPQVTETATAPMAMQGNQGGTVSTINVVTSPAPSQTTTSGSIATNNILQDKDLAKDPMNPGYYFLGYHPSQGTTTDATTTAAPTYFIEYIDATQYFNIALLAEPIGPTRLSMEQYLMLHLGLSQDQMCKLNYMVSVPQDINDQYSGQNLKFSFCPGAIPLPQ